MVHPDNLLSTSPNSCSAAATQQSALPAKKHRIMDLVSKPRSKSVVWLYFGFKADEKGQPLNSGEVICRLCRKKVLAKGGNTTNLRSHLKRRHRAQFFKKTTTTTKATLDFNHGDLFEDGLFLRNASNTNYVPDAVLPPGEPWLRGGPSRATLSLPSCLFLCGEPGSEVSAPGFSGEEQMGEMKVYAKCHLQDGVTFGPYVGEVCRGKMPTDLKYAWAIRDDAAFVYVDASDESKSNWMRYVTYTSREDGHNLVVFQFYRHIYYKVSQPITEGGELRVCIGKDYATLLGIEMGDNMKCEVGDKETFLGLLHDIQLVTLPEPSSSSLWSDRSQSQSPKLVISDVTTMSNSDAGSDSGMMATSTFPSVISPASFQSFDKYDFMPGTERLLSNPNATATSPWYFFGLEPDPTGRPLDRCTAVCKLCVGHVGCGGGGGGGAADLHNHLTSKHHIRLPRDGIKDRTFLPIGSQRSQPVMVNGSLVGTPPPGALRSRDRCHRQLSHHGSPAASCGGRGRLQTADQHLHGLLQEAAVTVAAREPPEKAPRQRHDEPGSAAEEENGKLQ
ncbi:uncharacterized protein AB9W97_015176 isoform 3-T6 [Spinachia spinachia]